MTDNKPKDPDNIRFSKSTRDPENTVVWTPYNYRSAQAAIKEAGGTFLKDQEKPGGIWVIKGMTDAQEQAIRAGAQEDIALGQEGRKAREDARKDTREAEKAEKAAAAEKTPEDIEAAKQARAEAKAKRDASRVEVEAGSVGIGDTVEKNGAKHEVNHIGETYEKGGKQMAYAYFGDLGAELAAKAAEKAKEEDASPSM
jgi:hypothetical protein